MVDRLVVWISNIRRLLAEAPGSLESIEARGRDRLRRVVLSGIAVAGSTGVAIVTGLISIPLTVGYLGPERYGVWLTMSSLLTWLMITDIGLGGTALINVLAEARGREDDRGAQSIVSTASVVLCGIATTLAGAILVLDRYCDWALIFNAGRSVETTELRVAVLTAVLLFSLMFPASILNSVYSAYQEAYIGSVWNTAANLGSLGSLLIVVRSKGGLPLLVTALSGSRLVICLLNAVYLFGFRHKEIRPRLAMCSSEYARRLLRLGWKNLVQQLAGIGMFQSQPMIIARALGPQDVGVFNVSLRVLTLPLMVVGFFSFPLVAAYGEARARNDWPWIWKTLRRSVLSAVAMALVLGLPLCVVAGPLIEVWLGKAMAPPLALVLYLSLYSLINAVLTPIAAFFTGIEWVGSQAVLAIINASVTVLLGMALIERMHLPGMGAAMAIGMFVNGVGQYWLVWTLYARKRIRRTAQ